MSIHASNQLQNFPQVPCVVRAEQENPDFFRGSTSRDAQNISLMHRSDDRDLRKNHFGLATQRRVLHGQGRPDHPRQRGWMSLAGRESFLDITEQKGAEKALEERTEYLLIETCPQPKGILALYQDITERKQIEAELRESEDRFRTAFE